MIRRPPRSTRTDTLFPYTTRFRSQGDEGQVRLHAGVRLRHQGADRQDAGRVRRLHRRAAALRLLRHPAELPAFQQDERSEEHTSELQSLMRISYAVFCLQKKKNNNTI